MEQPLRAEFQTTLEAVKSAIGDTAGEDDTAKRLTQLAEVYKTLEWEAKAKHVLAEAVRFAKEPTPNEYSETINSLIKDNRDDEAEELIQQWLSSADTLPDEEKTYALARLSSVFVMQYRFEEALAVIDRIPDQDERNSRVSRLASYLAMENHFDKAHALVTGRNLGMEGWVDLAYGLAGTEYETEAREAIRHALDTIDSVPPGETKNRLLGKITQVFATLGDLDNFEQLKQIVPSISQDEIQSLYEAFLSNENLHHAVIDQFIRKQKLEEAIQWAERTEGVSSTLLYSIATALVEAKQLEAAQAFLRSLLVKTKESINNSAKDLVCLIHLAATLAHTGLKEEALDAFNVVHGWLRDKSQSGYTLRIGLPLLLQQAKVGLASE